MSDVIEQSTATEQTGAVNPADAIAAMIAANKRNAPQPESTTPPAGQAPEKSVAPEAAPVEEAEPENSASETDDAVDEENTEESTDGVNEAVDFLEFAEQNPDMLWRIPNKDAEGGFIEIPVSKAAAILGQGSAIHENARKLKTERADFEEYEANRRKRTRWFANWFRADYSAATGNSCK
jgi:type IV secretory pathway VirB10-like protein